MPLPALLLISTSALWINLQTFLYFLLEQMGEDEQLWAVSPFLCQNWENEILHSQWFSQIYSNLLSYGVWSRFSRSSQWTLSAWARVATIHVSVSRIHFSLQPLTKARCIIVVGSSSLFEMWGYLIWLQSRINMTMCQSWETFIATNNSSAILYNNILKKRHFLENKAA